uniref:Uncharacterized protein n=1 Tax=Kalanchoe fedtschenkoi TaxID=63787 RepID=A0A7N0T6G5_KALFE
MEGSVDDLSAAPDSWEVADLDESVRKLKLSLSDSKGKSKSSSSSLSELVDDSAAGSAAVGSDAAPTEEALNQIDQFLREALQNPRERLSVLRMEQDVEKFIRDPKQQQLEFQQLPTSYLRLAAHRVAQHYSLQSMVLLDNSLPDGSGSRIIVMKTPECRLPKVRLADIPLSLPSDGNDLVKVAIKQRPQKRSQASSSGNSNSLKSNNSKSVEERKEEYNRARARIFSSSSSGTGGVVKQEIETKIRENIQQGSAGIPKVEDKSVSGGNDVSLSRSFSDSSTGGSRSSRTKAETETGGRYRPNNRVAIFRDREIECKDPDYDRSYDRYMQRFDPGFGFNGGAYTMQPMYTPAVNYNTEFPQLGAVHRPHIPSEHQARPLPQHLPGPWSAAGVSYGHGLPEAMMAAFGPNHLARSSSAIYPYSSHYLCQRPGIPFMHPQEQIQPYTQSHQQPDASYGYARPR